MTIHEASRGTKQARRTVFVEEFTDGLLGPDVPMLGPVADGGHIVWNSTPGCWGPMITPAIRGGHEVCRPVAVEGADVGDAVAIRIKDIAVTSLATSSGNDQPDRKSTRLNSSHANISYAVFCLKKKKKKYQIIDYSTIINKFPNTSK